MPVVVHAYVPLGVLGHDGNQCSTRLDRGLHQQHRAGLACLGELECAVGGDRPGYFDLPSLQVDVLHGQRAEFTRSQAGVDGKRGCRDILRVQATFRDDQVELLMRQWIRLFLAHGKACARSGESRYTVLVALAPGEEACEGGQVMVRGRWCTGFDQSRPE